jgi:hypothetical protein
MSSADSFGTKYNKPHQPRDVEEEEGLLSGIADSSSKHSDSEQPSPWSRKRIIGTAIFFIALLLTGTCVRRLVLGPLTPPGHSLWFSGEGDLRSNGTHDFKRTVLIVSIDGLRCVTLCLVHHPLCLCVTVERTIWIVVLRPISLLSVRMDCEPSP